MSPEPSTGSGAPTEGPPLSLTPSTGSGQALPRQGGGDATGRVAAIVLAAGSSARMGFDKMWAPLGGQPVVAWAIRAAAASSLVDHVIVTVPADTQARMQQLMLDLGVRAQIVPGGAERQDSVRAALEACSEIDWVVVHDAARPFLTEELIERGLAAARETGAAIAAVPVVDTIKVVADSMIVATPPRETLWAAQTPQVFRRDLLLAAHHQASQTASDDAALVESLGTQVRVYQGAYGNIKITTPVDLGVAAALLASRDTHKATMEH